MIFRDSLPDLQSRIRILHAIPNAPDVDVYASGILLGRNLSFSNITCYAKIAPGKYDIQIFLAGTYDKPLFSRSIELLPNTSSTINLITLDNENSIFVLNDANITGSISNSFLRFINLSPNAPLLTLSLPNDIALFGNVEYVETTGYYPLSPALYNFKVSFSSAEGLFKYIKEQSFKNGKFYTIYIIGLLNKKPQIGYLLVEDGK